MNTNSGTNAGTDTNTGTDSGMDTDSGAGPGPDAGTDPVGLAALRGSWSALGGDPALQGRLRLVTREGALPARLPVSALARAAVACCALAAAELAAVRAGSAVPYARVDDGAVAAAFVSERHLRVDERADPVFAPLSRIWRTRDGWLRTHANYPHHKARLLSALGIQEDAATPDRVAAELAGRDAVAVETAVAEAGGIAVAQRTLGDWEAHPHARAAIADAGLLSRKALPGPGRGLRAHEFAPGLPASGLRVLDLTRVIAGPVAGRTLALLGADVLRVDPPGLPELPGMHADTGFGKRSTALALERAADRAVFEELLGRADVVLTGYRPGSLDRFGLAPEALTARRPGPVVAQLSAWGDSGPWRGRRGFDSVVQFATGISAVEGGDEGPGVLPAQALDHGTGYLMAAAVLRSLTEQLQGAGPIVNTFALARTAWWLTHGFGAGEGAQGAGSPRTERGGPLPTREEGAAAWLTVTDCRLGRVRHALPPFTVDGGPRTWAAGPGPLGGDAPRWAQLS